MRSGPRRCCCCCCCCCMSRVGCALWPRSSLQRIPRCGLQEAMEDARMAAKLRRELEEIRREVQRAHRSPSPPHLTRSSRPPLLSSPLLSSPLLSPPYHSLHLPSPFSPPSSPSLRFSFLPCSFPPPPSAFSLHTTPLLLALLLPPATAAGGSYLFSIPVQHQAPHKSPTADAATSFSVNESSLEEELRAASTASRALQEAMEPLSAPPGLDHDFETLEAESAQLRLTVRTPRGPE